MSFYSQYVGFNGSLYLPLAGGSMSGGIAVDVDNTIDLGTTLKAWRRLYAYGVDSPGALALGGTLATSLLLGRAGQTLQANHHLTPSATNTLDLGTSTNVFRAGYMRALDSDAALAVGGVNATSVLLGRAGQTLQANNHLTPSASNTLDLGAAANVFRAVYSRALDSDAALAVGGVNATSVLLGRAGQTLQVNNHLVSSATNTLDLGASGNVFRAVYSRALNSDAALAIDGAGALTVGPTNATSLALGNAGITTTILGTLRYDNTNTATAGGGSTISQWTGFLVVNVGGVSKRVPYCEP